VNGKKISNHRNANDEPGGDLTTAQQKAATRDGGRMLQARRGRHGSTSSLL